MNDTDFAAQVLSVAEKELARILKVNPDVLRKGALDLKIRMQRQGRKPVVSGTWSFAMPHREWDRQLDSADWRRIMSLRGIRSKIKNGTRWKYTVLGEVLRTLRHKGVINSYYSQRKAINQFLADAGYPEYRVRAQGQGPRKTVIRKNV